MNAEVFPDAPDTPNGPDAQDEALVLCFVPAMEAIEGVLALAGQWAESLGASRDCRMSLRLVLEELLTNMAFHASQNAAVELHLCRMEGVSTLGATVRVRLLDSGQPFNPLEYEPRPVTSAVDTPTGGRGLALVRLLTLNGVYTRRDNRNELTLDLAMENEPDRGALPVPAANATDTADTAHFRWRQNLAVRQTVVFALISALLLWSGIGLYAQSVSVQCGENARLLSEQVMRTLDVISLRYMTRTAAGVHTLAREIAATAGPLADAPGEAVIRSLLVAERSVEGVVLSDFRLEPEGPEGKTVDPERKAVGFNHGKHRLFSTRHPAPTELSADAMNPSANTPWLVFPPQGEPPRWQGPFLPGTAGLTLSDKAAAHGLMVYTVPWHAAPQTRDRAPETLPSEMFPPETFQQATRPPDGAVSLFISMPTIIVSLHKLSNFSATHPVLFNRAGEYAIFPPGRGPGAGPQSVFDDAAALHSPELARMAERCISGKSGLIALDDLFSSSGRGQTERETDEVWHTAWDGPGTLLYHPLRLSGWFLGMIVPSEELGILPLRFSTGMLLLALLAPPGIALGLWLVFSRTLRPLRELTAALEGMSSGDLDSPLPPPRYQDETGRMLLAFERTRVTLKAMFQNMVRTTAAQERLRNELAVARSIQESMLPDGFPELPGLEICARLDMAREVCGDLYDCFVLHDESACTTDNAADSPLCCVVGDVCGKGIPAALLMSCVMPLVRTALLDGLHPAAVLERVNASLLRNNPENMFVTLLVGILDTSTGTFCWASAGHPPPMRTVPSSTPGALRHVECLPWTGDLVLGVRAHTRYRNWTCRLEPGQSLLLYSDGADEAMGPSADGEASGPLFGDERLAEALARTRPEDSAEQQLAAVHGAILAHMGGMPPQDDSTLLLVRRMDSGQDAEK